MQDKMKPLKTKTEAKTNPNTKVRMRVEARDEMGQQDYRFSIEFIVFQENNVYVAYCPALDISSSGKNFNEAVGNFYEMFQLHIECCIENHTLHEDLLAHGWVLNKKNITPPKFSSLLKKKEVSRVLNGNFGFEKVVSPVRIPSFA